MTMTRTSTAARWLTFNGIGGIGVLVQLVTLAALTKLADLALPLATLLAVELAILHNFAWHQRVTWSSRPARDARHRIGAAA